MTDHPAPATAPAPNQANALRDLLKRVNTGEFDLGKKDFHQFVVKEIYPRLGDGALTVADFERITMAYSARSDPYNNVEG